MYFVTELHFWNFCRYAKHTCNLYFLSLFSLLVSLPVASFVGVDADWKVRGLLLPEIRERMEW